MNQTVTTGIVLARTNYGEADRILTILTPDQGKLRLIAKGVRKSKSKLAGGIELLSVSDITFIRGRGDIGTLVSTRLQTHYGDIVKDIDRTMIAYECIKQLNKATEDEPEPEYFTLLQQSLEALNQADVSLELIQLWFSAQLLKLAGHTPNLQTDTTGVRLAQDKSYTFSFDDMTFTEGPTGRFTAAQIKLLRLLFGDHTAQQVRQVQGIEKYLEHLTPLVQTMRSLHVGV